MKIFYFSSTQLKWTKTAMFDGKIGKTIIYLLFCELMCLIRLFKCVYSCVYVHVPAFAHVKSWFGCLSDGMILCGSS